MAEGYSHFVLERKEDGRFIGRCGLKYWEQLVTGLGFHRDRPETLFGHAITIYVLHRSTNPRTVQSPAVHGD